MFMAPSVPVQKYVLCVYVVIDGEPEVLTCLIEPVPVSIKGSWRVNGVRSKFPPGGREGLRASLTEEEDSSFDSCSGATVHPAMPTNANSTTGDAVVRVLVTVILPSEIHPLDFLEMSEFSMPNAPRSFRDPKSRAV